VSAESVDVAIVGYGPVGQALALQLGRAGHRIAVFERFQEAYRMPRAVHIDHEVMRLLQDLGLADELAGEMVAVSEYRWFGADGEPLMTLGQPAPSASGWEPDYLFFQPALEATLDRAVAAQPSVTVQRGWAAEPKGQGADHLQRVWTETGCTHGFGPDEAVKLIGTPVPPATHAIEDVFARQRHTGGPGGRGAHWLVTQELF
jgi:2-polyprenyl-6-methoxyphenol hydroxylase-like FAD-dependent oxidoreductase